jgi:ketosteroid isomerase-like protein
MKMIRAAFIRLGCIRAVVLLLCVGCVSTALAGTDNWSADVAKFAAHAHKTTKTLVYDIEPVTVRVHGNIAYVHYIFTEIVKDAEGKEKNQKGRSTDILMKQGNKWVMIADHGGEFPPKT